MIAGQYAGKTLRCSPKLKPTYDRLNQAALRGHHWARIAIKELNALSTGPLGKNNVFVKPLAQRPRGVDQFVVFLPGLKAIVERHTDDQYFLVDMELDAQYFEATARSTTRAGLYRATPEATAWTTEYVRDGQLLRKEGRVVAIADGGYRDANFAARATVPRVMKVPGVPTATVRAEGCDLHFSPGKRRLGGLRRYSAAGHEGIHGSATLLAETIYQARDLTGVAWVADRGGSVVLTQAFALLANRGVSLKGHTAYLHRPKNSPGQTLRLAHRLELTLSEAFADTAWDLTGTLSQAKVAPLRLNNKKDPYSHGYHAHAWINGIVKAGSIAGVAGAGATALGASIPMVATIGGIVASSSGAIGAAGTIYALGRSLAEDVQHKFKR